MIAIKTRKANKVCNENLRTGITLAGEGDQLQLLQREMLVEDQKVEKPLALKRELN